MSGCKGGAWFGHGSVRPRRGWFSRVTVFGSLIAMTIGVVSALRGHPGAVAWGAGVAGVLVGLDLLERAGRTPMRPRPASKTALPPWLFAALIAFGLGMAAAFPLAWSRNITRNSDETPFRQDHISQTLFFVGSSVGVTFSIAVTVWWIRDALRARRARSASIGVESPM
jgi:hypothetical protein